MPRPKNPVPAYTHHKPSGQEYVRLPNGSGGRRIVYLGRWGSPESKAEYRRVLAELQVPSQPQAPLKPALVGPAVNEVLLAFLRWALTHYQARMVNPQPRSRRSNGQ